jgi:capsular polysaccharide biosynthesis protein
MVRLPAKLRPLFPYLKPVVVQATRMAAPTNQFLSRRGGGHLPSGVVPTLSEAAVSTGGRYEQARAAEVVQRPPMVGVPADLPLTDPSDGHAVAAIGVAELPRGRVLGPHHAVVTSRGDLVQEVSRYFGTRRPREHPLFLNPFPAPPHQIDGRLGVLAARGDANYYHYLMDVIVKLGVLEQTPSVPVPEHWYASVSGAPFQRQLLELAGLSADSLVDAVEHPHVTADTLVVPAPPAMSEMNPPWAVQWLRDRLLPRVDSSGPRQRIYVTRGPSANNRTVLNDGEVTALLESRGFVLVDPGTMTVAEQIRTFANADIIVATHGAALANLVFASPGATVIELFPSGCLLPDYWRLASALPGLRYRYLTRNGQPPRGGRAATLVRDIDVDVPALRRMLDDLD